MEGERSGGIKRVVIDLAIDARLVTFCASKNPHKSLKIHEPQESYKPNVKRTAKCLYL